MTDKKDITIEKSGEENIDENIKSHDYYSSKFIDLLGSCPEFVNIKSQLSKDLIKFIKNHDYILCYKHFPFATFRVEGNKIIYRTLNIQFNENKYIEIDLDN